MHAGETMHCTPCYNWVHNAWWRHQMETFSALLALCAGNSPVTGEFPSQGQWRGALMLSLAWINGWLNNRKAGDLRRHRVHYDVSVMKCLISPTHLWRRCQTDSIPPWGTSLMRKRLPESRLGTWRHFQIQLKKTVFKFKFLMTDADVSQAPVGEKTSLILAIALGAMPLPEPVWLSKALTHQFSDVIMSAMASQITNLTIVYLTIYSCADQMKHQSSASLAFVRGIHQWPVNSPHKGPVTLEMFPFDDVIMMYAEPGLDMLMLKRLETPESIINSLRPSDACMRQ